MNLAGKGPIIGMVLAAAAAGGWLIYKAWPATLPNVALDDGAGEPITLDAMRQGKDYLVLVFLLEGCPISKFSLELVTDQRERWSERAAFAGLLLAPAARATSFQEDQELEMPIYGLRSATDPFAVNELFEKVGSSYGTGSAIYGGTVVVVDADLTVQEVYEKEAVRELPNDLASLLD